MKLYLFSFLFFSFYLICASPTLHKDEMNLSVSTSDSIQYYYTMAKNTKTDLSTRIRFIEKAIRQANLENIDTLYLEVLAYKSKIYGKSLAYDLALSAVALLEKESIKREQRSFVALAYNKYGYYEGKKGNLALSYKWYDKSLKLYKELGDGYNVVIMSKRLANVLNTQGAYIDAEQIVTEALPYGNVLDDTSELSWLYDILAIGKRNRKQFEEAISYHHKAIEFETSLKSILSLRNNYALTLIESEDYEEAINEYEILLVDTSLLNRGTYHRFLDNYAYAKSKLGHPDAEKTLTQVLQLRMNENEIEGQFASHIHLADLYKTKENAVKSKFHAMKALEIGRKIKSPEGRLRALEYLNSFNKMFFDPYLKLRDSIQAADDSNKSKFAKERYDYSALQKREAVALQQKTESELNAQKEKSKKSIAYLALLAIVILSGILYAFQLQRSKKRQLAERVITASKISKKVHDVLANDMFSLRSELALQKVPQVTLQKIDQLYERTRDISKEHSPVDTETNFPETISFMLRGMLTQDVKLVLKGIEDVPWSTISGEKKLALYRCLQELMVNMKKHSRASIVVIAFTKAKKNLDVHYYDNGVGSIPQVSSGSGLQNVESRISALKGTCTFEFKKDAGCEATIVIPA